MPRRASLGKENASPQAMHVANRVVSSANYQDMSFTIIDKVCAKVMVFDAMGKAQRLLCSVWYAATIPCQAAASASSPVFALMNALHQRAASSRHGTGR